MVMGIFPFQSDAGNEIMDMLPEVLAADRTVESFAFLLGEDTLLLLAILVQLDVVAISWTFSARNLLFARDSAIYPSAEVSLSIFRIVLNSLG